MTIGEKIRKLRIEAGLLQRELAEIVGVTKQTVNGWETNKQAPLPKAIKKLNEYFEVDLVACGPEFNGNKLAQNSAKCRKCEYLWGNRASGTALCDYFGRTGELRRCPSGDNCYKFKPRTGYKTYGKDFKI